jgi:formate dehydrogenase major subunit
MGKDSIDESDLEVRGQQDHAAGVTAVAVSMKRSLAHMGVKNTAKTLLKLNQADGFDCMSCAWPDPDPENRHAAEFCENGAKAVAEEATKARATPAFFARHSIAELDAHDEYWLGQQGRITHPMVKRPGSTHYEPLEWDEANAIIATHLTSLDSPDEAIFYTSGRASNEAAFAYQLFARALGTNNMPDCSNMCHESTSIALAESIGIGKASVSMKDVYEADLIVIAGQNPGTNHPRMLSALEIAKRRGARIIAINPLREAGLHNFRNPQVPRGIVGKGTDIADLHLPIKINGDLAFFQAVGSLLVEWDALDHDFIKRHSTGFEQWAEHVRSVDWSTVERATGLSRAQITQAAEMIRDSGKTIYCWAMGLTQHRNAVATIKEVCNVAFARGDIGKPGAGLFPVRGHSNVQGDRTMGIWERPPQSFLDSLQAEFGFDPPREHGLDTVDSIRAMRDGKAHVFIGLGGNFVHASPDTAVTAEAMTKTRLTVQISTKLNRSHLRCGDTALILPTLGRTEKDVRGGKEQFISVEDSVCAVHASRGVLDPASPHLRSETAIICGFAEATLGDRHGIRWAAMRDDYDVIRDHISRVVVGCEDYTARRVRAAPPAARHAHVPDRVGAGRVRDLADRRAARAGGSSAAADPAQPRPVQHHDLRPERPLPRHRGRTTGGLRAPRRHRVPGLLGRRPRRPDGSLGRRRHRPHGARLPHRRVRHASWHGGGLLPRDQSAGAAGLDRRVEQHADVQGRHHHDGAR